MRYRDIYTFYIRQFSYSVMTHGKKKTNKEEETIETTNKQTK